ncbi:MAG: hypothetical protein COA78_21920 [Blastopirellula sp.]|nr:MAG: hypothetical protein COA78_21920 [Blastopirellula sp.]
MAGNPFAALGQLNQLAQPKPVNGFAIGQEIGTTIKRNRTNAALADVLNPDNPNPSEAFAALARVDAGVANKIQQQRQTQTNRQTGFVFQDRGLDLREQQQDQQFGLAQQRQGLSERQFQFSQEEAARKASIPPKADLRKDASGFLRDSATGERVFPDAKGKTPVRRIIKDVNNESRFADTGELVLPNVKKVFDAKGNLDKSKFAQSLRKEFSQGSKDFNALKSIIGKLKISANDKTGAGDVSLIFQYMKMLDPRSTVREGEFATASNTGGWTDSMRNMYNKAREGTFLEPEQRADFVNLAEKFLGDEKSIFDVRRSQMVNEAREAGIKPSRIIAGFKDSQATEKASLPVASSPIDVKFESRANQNVKPELLSKWQEVQTAFGQQLSIVSGFRDPARNKRAGGASKSQHIHGNALDINTAHLSDAQKLDLIKKASAAGFTGIGVYKNNLHFDLGGRRSWGADFKSRSVPSWAKPTIRKHLAKQHKAQDQTPNEPVVVPQQVEQQAEQEDQQLAALPVAPLTPPPTPQQDEVSQRQTVRGSSIPQAAEFGVSDTVPQSALDRSLKTIGGIAEGIEDTRVVAADALIPFKDEGTGFLLGLEKTLRDGGDLGDNIDDAIDLERQKLIDAKLRTKGAETLGTIIGGGVQLVATGAAGAAVKTLKGQAGLGAGVGALTAGDTIQGSLEKRFPLIFLGAGLGAAGATAISGLFKTGAFAKGLFKGGEKSTSKSIAEGKILKAFRDDEVPIEQAGRAVRSANRAGVPTSLSDIGESNVSRLARGIKTQGGSRGSNKAVEVLTQRSLTQPDRIVNATNKMFGNPDEFVTTLSTIDASRAKLAQPFYKKFFGQKVEMTPRLTELLGSPSVQKAMRLADRGLKDELRGGIHELDVAGNKIITSEGWDAIKKSLADLSGISKRTGSTNKSIDSARKQLADELKRISPDYKKALDIYSDSSTMQEAFEAGIKIMKMEDFQVAKLFSAATSGEKEMMRLGVAKNISSVMESTVAKSPDFAKKLFTDAKFKAIRPLFPNAQSFAKFKRMITLEHKRFSKGAFVTGGSPTADKAADVGGVLSDVAELAAGSPRGASITMFKKLLNKISGGIDEKVSDEMADILFELKPENITLILSRLERAGRDGKLTPDNFTQKFGRILSTLSAEQIGDALEGF